MDNFFYNLNKKMADLAERQDLAESAVTERDMGKHNNATTGFKALAKKAGAKYGSKAAGERVAGAQFQKMKKAGQLQEIGDTPAGKAALGSYIKKAHASGDAARMSSAYEPMGSKEETQARRTVQKRAGGIGQAVDRLTKENAEGHCSACDCSPCECVEESALQGYLGKKKYGPEGMKALQKAGREHAGKDKMDKIRNRYDKMDEVVRATNAYGDSGNLVKYSVFYDLVDVPGSKTPKKVFSVVKLEATPEQPNFFGENPKTVKRGIESRKEAEAIADKLNATKGKMNEGSMKDAMWRDAERMSREQFCAKWGDEHGEFWDNISGEMDEGNAFSGAVANAKRDHKSEFEVDGKKYKVTEADPMGMEEGAFKDADAGMKQPRHKVGRGELNQVPGVQHLKPDAKEHPLKNVAKGVKAFVQGKPEPMDEAKAKPDYIDLDHDGDKKETMKKAAADKKRSSGTAFDPEARKQMKTDREGTGNFDKKKISTGTVYTRRHKEDDEEQVTSNEPKRKGRPKGPAKGPERVTAKSYKYKQGRPVKENGIAITDRGEYDDEAGMAKDQLHTIVRHARELERALGAGDNLPEWVQEKMGQIKGMMTSVTDYMLSQKERGIEADRGEEGIRIAEKAVSVKQRRAAGIAHAAQKGEIPKKELRGASKAMARMPAGELHKFAATKEKGLPKKVKEGGKPDFLDLDKDGNKTEPMKQAAKQANSKKKEVDETTTSGSVASAPAKAKTNAGGMTFGKGVYEGAVNESYERKLRDVLNEGMNVTVNMNGQGQKSVNVSADGEDAEKLAQILKLAGLGGQSSGCSSCGQSSCGCDTVDEAYGDATATKNSPDWPTDRETIDANDPHLRRLSGGLNGPKSTGQTTIPVIASQTRRQDSIEENVKLERSLFNTWKTYKGQ